MAERGERKGAARPAGRRSAVRGEALASAEPAPIAEAGPAAGDVGAAQEPDRAGRSARGRNTRGRVRTTAPDLHPSDLPDGTDDAASIGSGAPSPAEPVSPVPAPEPSPDLVLDLGGEAIVLLRRESLGWREIARAPIDPEGEVRGTPALLRAAQGAANVPAPEVILWLPPDQVLARRAVLPDAPEARIDAALAEAATATGQSPADLAVAVSPPGPDGSSSILAAYRQSCREARAYATGWGFTPLRVSTAVEAGAFGDAGPELLDREEIEARRPVAARVVVPGRTAGDAPRPRAAQGATRPRTPDAAEPRDRPPDPARFPEGADAPAPGAAPGRNPPRPSSAPAANDARTPSARRRTGRRGPAAALVAAGLLLGAGSYFAFMPGAAREDAGAARTARPGAPVGATGAAAIVPSSAQGRIAPSPVGEVGAPVTMPAAPSSQPPDTPPGARAGDSGDRLSPGGPTPADPLSRPNGHAAAPGAMAPEITPQGTAGTDQAGGAIAGLAGLPEPRASLPPPSPRTRPTGDTPGAPAAPAALDPVPRPPVPGIRLAAAPLPPAVPDSGGLQAGALRMAAAPSTVQGKTPDDASPAITVRNQARSAIAASAGRVGKLAPAPITPAPSAGHEPPTGAVPAESLDEPGTALAQAPVPDEAAADPPGLHAPAQSPAPMTRETTGGAGTPRDGSAAVAGAVQSPPQGGDPGDGEAAPQNAETTEASPVAPGLAPPPATREAVAADAEVAPGSADPEPADPEAQAAQADAAEAADASPLALLHAPPPASRPRGLGAPIRPSARGAGADAAGRAALPGLGRSAPRQVERAAVEQGIPLDRTALIGILNFETGRQALLRLPNGRYERLVVGDSVEGWRVSVIGTDTMRLSRNGEERTLRLVNR